MKYGLSEKQLQEIRDTLASHDAVEKAILFGSRVIDTYKEASDVDIAIKGEKADFSLAATLKDQLEEETYLPFFFDVVAYDSIESEELRRHIDGKGKVLYQKGMSEWREVKLGDYIKTNKSSIAKDYPYSNILYLDTGSITVNKIDKLQEYNISDAPSRAKRLVEDGDVIYSSVRPNQLHYGFIKNPKDNMVVSTGFVVISCDKKNIQSKFLFYYLSSDNSTEYLHSIAEASTSTYPSLKPNDIEALEVSLPPLPEQKAIAEVLSSLDDKIDLLHRQNKTLEQMAETLFRQWFVEEAGDDWEEKPLSFFGDIVCGKTPPKKKKEFYNGDVPFIKIPDMHGKTFIFSTDDSLTAEGKNAQIKKTLPPKSICISCIATVGLVSLTTKESHTNQQINSIIPNEDKYRYYLFLQMKYSYDLLHSMASGGTATLNLNTGNFSKINIPLPKEKTLKEFQNKVEPFFDKIYKNQQQIRTLEKIRDTLLPKLMSGAIRVKLNTSG